MELTTICCLMAYRLGSAILLPHRASVRTSFAFYTTTKGLKERGDVVEGHLPWPTVFSRQPWKRRQKKAQVDNTKSSKEIPNEGLQRFCTHMEPRRSKFQRKAGNGNTTLICDHS